MHVKVYNEKKTSDMKLWQFQANVSAWLQGQYIRAAIDSMFPKGQKYPEKPFEIFTHSENKALPPEELQIQEALENERSIRERSEQIDKMLANKGKPPVEIVGEKRI